MRLSNVWHKFRQAALCAFGIYVLLFCAYQLYSAVIFGTVMPASRALDDWVTFQSNPGFFVFSIFLYGFFVVIGTAAVSAEFFETLRARRWRSRQEIDHAIRQTPQER